MKRIKIVSFCFCLLSGAILSACGNKGPLFLPQAEKPGVETKLSSEQNSAQNLKDSIEPRAAGVCPFARMAKGIDPLP